MKRKIKKIIAGILFASMLTGNVSMNVVYGTENYGDRIEENQSANIEDGGKQFTEEDNAPQKEKDQRGKRQIFQRKHIKQYEYSHKCRTHNNLQNQTEFSETIFSGSLRIFSLNLIFSSGISGRFLFL